MGLLQFSSLPYKKVPYGKTLTMSIELFELFKGYSGHVEYYLWGGGLTHGGICFRKCDDNDAVGQLELVFGKSSGWTMIARLGKWRPPESDQVKTSLHPWNMATAIEQMHNVSKEFGTWTALKNCNHWKAKVEEILAKEGPKES